MEKTRREKSYSRRYCSFKEGNEVVRSSRFKNSVHSKGEVFEEVFMTLKGAHLREEFVDDGEREFVDVLVSVLLESLNLVQPAGTTPELPTRVTRSGRRVHFPDRLAYAIPRTHWRGE